MISGKTLLDYTNLFSPNDYKKILLKKYGKNDLMSLKTHKKNV